jgi:hypothetical protein
MPDESIDRLVESLAQINVNLESLRVSLGALNEFRLDHEQRLRSIERWKYNLTPILAAITFLLGAFFNAAIRSYR